MEGRRDGMGWMGWMGGVEGGVDGWNRRERWPNVDSVHRISARYSIRREVKQTGYLPASCHGAVNVSCGRTGWLARTAADSALQCTGSSGGQADGRAAASGSRNPYIYIGQEVMLGRVPMSVVEPSTVPEEM